MKRTFFQTRKTPAQAMVEFALVLPILLLVVYGLIEVGRLLFIYSSVVTAARSAARYGSTTGLNVSGGVPRYQDCAGMRSAAQRSSFMANLQAGDIALQHDRGEGVSTTDYCPTGDAVDTTNFQPSAGNIDRVRVTVTTQYTPILRILPLGPFPITSTSARTILVSVPVQITAAPMTWGGETSTPTLTRTPTSSPTATVTVTPTITQTPTISQTPTITFTPSITLTPSQTGTPTKTGTPTMTGTATFTPSPTGTPFVCDVKHSAIKTSPSYSMTVFNDSVATTIHIASIEVYFEATTPAGQALTSISFGGVTIWTGSIPGSPGVISVFTGDVSVNPLSSKLLTFGFDKNYKDNGSEVIVVNFAEAPSCPPLDSTNDSQLK